MICPSCKAVVDVLEGACPTCQGDAQPPTIVESTSRSAALAVAHLPTASYPSVGEWPGERFPVAPVKLPIPSAISMPPVVSSGNPSVPYSGSGQFHPVLAALPRLPALLWRQPIVRATVRTGASAVALSLALRMAGRMLTNRASLSRTASTARPTLADLFALPDSTARRHTRRQRRHATREEGDTVETLIYIRRVFRNAR